MAGRWRDTTPDELADWLAAVQRPWAFAGGWALTLWSGHQHRPHSDIEIACLSADLPDLLADLPGFEAAVARNKQLTPWSDPPPEPPFSLWLRRQGQALWDFEIVVEQHRDERWLYRRDNRITLPLANVFRPVASGRCVIAPEVQLLYKCSAPRDKDLADLRVFVPKLDADAQAWLFAAIEIAHPALSDYVLGAAQPGDEA